MSAIASIPAVPALTVRLVEDPEQLLTRRAEWDALVERSSTPTVFQTLEWQLSWWRAFGQRHRALIVLAEQDGVLVGVAPLMVAEKTALGRRYRAVQFIGTGACDYSDFIVERGREDVVEALLRWLGERSAEWTLLHLHDIAETSPLLHALPRFFPEPAYTVDIRLLYECPSRRLGDEAADRKVISKKDIRENLNRLRRRGPLEFEVLEQQQIEGCLEHFFGQHMERWADTPTPSFFADPRQRVFYRELVRLLAARGWVLFATLTSAGAPVAHQFGFRYGGRIYLIKPTFDPRYRDCAPGILMFRYLIEYALAQGLEEVDFTIGEEKYKYRFSNHVRRNYAARVHSRWAFYGVDRLVQGSKRIVTRFPAVRSLGRRYLGKTLRSLGF